MKIKFEIKCVFATLIVHPKKGICGGVFMNIESLIRKVPNGQKRGARSRDITTLLKDAAGFKNIIDQLSARYSQYSIDKVVGIESRGFIIGSALAFALGKGFIPLRKPGMLPGETYQTQYELEYGFDKLEIHKDALDKGDNVLIVDDVLATGGTALGAISLVQKLEVNVVEFCSVVNLPDFKGEKRLLENGHKFFFLCKLSDF
jgi:adenine phosphoribosyltransferase